MKAPEPFDAAVDGAIAQTLSEHAETVAAWRLGTPKTWGLLAGQAVLATRRLVGRNLSETERRIVWDRLWRRLQELRER
jgi:hypothetical protein